MLQCSALERTPYCYMRVMDWRNERGERAGEGAPSPGVVQAVGSDVSPVGLGAKRTVVGGAGVEHASCGTWRGTWHLGASGGARRGGANKFCVFGTLACALSECTGRCRFALSTQAPHGGTQGLKRGVACVQAHLGSPCGSTRLRRRVRPVLSHHLSSRRAHVPTCACTNTEIRHR